jgi:hypothetical protein
LVSISVGGDFAAFQSATPQQADFANFQAAPAMLPPAPVQQAQPTEVSTSSLGGFSGFQGVAAPQPAVSPMPSSQPVPTAAVSSLQPGPLSAAQIMQQQPAVMQVSDMQIRLLAFMIVFSNFAIYRFKNYLQSIFL